jgi:uncharacterized Zn-binding protein involved in type VI secretion|tara:strand:- start:227 stop:541 length:315 start_codon:yes stop_codon:yes gene_type:complete
MTAVVRIGDSLSTGHGCASTTTIESSNQSTTNVYANSILIDIVGAPTVSHPFPPDPPCAPHTSQLNAGSPSVFINSIAVGRIGDSADAGVMTTGSPDVYANGVL